MISLYSCICGLLFLNVIKYTECDYLVKVKINFYSNLQNKCYRCTSTVNGTCNDGARGCNNVFRYCLIHSGSAEYCPSTNLTTSSVNFDSAPLNFTASTVLDLPNPFTLYGRGLLKEVQLLIKVNNGLGSEYGTLIDVFRVKITGRTSWNTPMTNRYSGVHDIAKIGLTYNVHCPGGGNGCINYCPDSCEPFNHCLSMPSSYSYQCLCLDGTWHNKCYCRTTFCGLGVCHEAQNGYYCDCPPYLSRQECETDFSRDACFEVNCNGGNCSSENNATTCSCPPDLTGKYCELVNYCHNVTCIQGACQNGKEDFECNCNAGFTGQLCEVNSNDCGSVSCSGKGSCIDQVNSYSCQCEDGYGGKDCEVATAAIQTSASNVPLWVGASVGVLVVIVLLLVLGTTAAVVLAKYKTKTTRCNEIDNKLVLTIGDNPVYMALSHSQKEEDERLFINPIYGCPDPALYAEAEAKPAPNQQNPVSFTSTEVKTPSGVSTTRNSNIGTPLLGNENAEYAIPVKASIPTSEYPLYEGLILNENKLDKETEMLPQETTQRSDPDYYCEISRECKKTLPEKEPGFYPSSTTSHSTTSGELKKPLLPPSGKIRASNKSINSIN